MRRQPPYLPVVRSPPTTVVFSLEKLADESGVTSLAYRELSQASDKSIVIARLAGDEAQFRYQDVAGKETENWSASATDLERLPASGRSL